MSNDSFRIARRAPPTDQGTIRAAKEQPGANLYDIDWPYREDQRTPPEAIRGSWAIDARGQLTERYTVNPSYRAIIHCTRSLKPYMHAGAKHAPDQWIVEIDPRGESLFPEIPQNLIRGWWYVDKRGQITDQFRPNSRWIEDGREPFSTM